ncbi:hypothetical protein [Gynuella sunshinyii]|uniref:Uncharacterized protein n=1 Tax=Gynuella sunshinyii YC6258 TaxID=1445510 RepID=A0A0C5VEI8_9GAMM|nr:hypothetical protein [Gynuella sunshinyii]AJQ92621.1 hypothetical Protein YC6258_00571 [Gynuella sunshinyii YC6258]
MVHDGFSNDDEIAAGNDPANSSSVASDIDADDVLPTDPTRSSLDVPEMTLTFQASSCSVLTGPMWRLQLITVYWRILTVCPVSPRSARTLPPVLKT